MINFYEITKAFREQLEDDETILKEQFKIQLGEYVNKDPDISPWCGVYKVKRGFTPGALGHSDEQWDDAMTIRAVVQASHYSGGEKCDEVLEKNIAVVLNAIQKDHTLGGKVEQLKTIDITYDYLYDSSGTILFQNAFIDFNFEVYNG